MKKDYILKSPTIKQKEDMKALDRRRRDKIEAQIGYMSNYDWENYKEMLKNRPKR